MDQADQALYQSKQAGRDKITHHHYRVNPVVQIPWVQSLGPPGNLLSPDVFSSCRHEPIPDGDVGSSFPHSLA